MYVVFACGESLKCVEVSVSRCSGQAFLVYGGSRVREVKGCVYVHMWILGGWRMVGIRMSKRMR